MLGGTALPMGFIPPVPILFGDGRLPSGGHPARGQPHPEAVSSTHRAIQPERINGGGTGWTTRDAFSGPQSATDGHGQARSWRFSMPPADNERPWRVGFVCATVPGRRTSPHVGRWHGRILGDGDAIRGGWGAMAGRNRGGMGEGAVHAGGDAGRQGEWSGTWLRARAGGTRAPERAAVVRPQNSFRKTTLVIP